MSTLENDIIIEDLQDRASILIPHLTKGDVEDFGSLLKDDLEGAIEWVVYRENSLPIVLDSLQEEVELNDD